MKNGEMKKTMSLLTELRKVAMHPLLLRQHYDDECLRRMAVAILQDPSHQDADPALVWEDMTVMSDYELHRMCTEKQVRGGG